MNIGNIKKISSQGESESVEFKKSTAQLRAACKTICAFLNGNGGIVLIGVIDDGKIIGQQVTDKTRKDIAEMLKKIDPFPCVEVNYIDFNDARKIIAIEVKNNFSIGPYVFEGRPYHRNQTTTSLMYQNHYQSLLLENLNSTKNWENIPSHSMNIGDLDEDEILKTIQQGIVKGRIRGKYTTDDPKKALIHLKLLDGEKPKNAAIVLFAKEVFPNYPQCLVRLARFKGVTKSEFIDNQQEFGNLFYLLDIATEFVRRHTPIAGKVRKGEMIRTDKPLIPVRAIREAIINALCHREYISTNRSISIGIYDDRLEITSPGRLPKRLSINKLKQTHDSCPRNETIANVLFRRGIIEQWGSGIKEIIDACVAAGLPEPEFIEDDDTFIVRFRANFSPTIKKEEEIILTDRQEEILKILKKHSPLSINELSKKMDSSLANVTIRKYLLELKKLGLIKSTGHAKTAKWESL